MSTSPPFHCTQCQSIVPEGSNFCGSCGTKVVRETRLAPIAERRRITVVFCDLVGSTVLSDVLDPEDLRDITSAYHEVCAKVIDQYEGHVAQYLGDGILIYFGYPIAHEDDALRAGRTALGIVEGITNLADRLRVECGIELQVRIGMHTGPVVVGEVGDGNRRENLALGRTPNVAARVQAEAEPGTILMSEDTLRLVSGFFECDDLGARTLKGINEPIRLFRLTSGSDVQNRLEARTTGTLTEFTGRDRELAQLVTLWAEVSDADRASASVLVSGEPGIGKSRLLLNLRNFVGSGGDTIIECACSTYDTNTPLQPIVGALARSLGFSRGTTTAEKLEALEAMLRQYECFSDTALLLLAQLIGITLDRVDSARLGLIPQQQREQTLDIVQRLVAAVTKVGPVLFVIEDLHWADPTTLELIDRLIHADHGRILILLTARPEFLANWTAPPSLTHIKLSRLQNREIEMMITRVCRHRRLPDDVTRLLIERCDGVPLFAEEITRAVLEAGVLELNGDRYELKRALPEDLVPATLNGSLVARLDRLHLAKPVAQLAAIIGREFRFDLLLAVTGQDAATLRARLRELTDAELIYEVAGASDVSYLFKHALIQEAAYQSLLKSARREMHLRIAQTLASSFADINHSRPEVLAQHFAAGGDVANAFSAWLQAGHIGLARAACHEAIEHIHRALEQLQLLPESRERDEQELEANVVMVTALQSTEGWGSWAIEKVCNRSTALLKNHATSRHAPAVSAQMMSFLTLRGQIDAGLALGKSRLQAFLAMPDAKTPMISLAYGTLAVLQLYHGDIIDAVEGAEHGLSMLTPELNVWAAQRIGLVPEVNASCYLSEALWMRGFPDRACAAIERANRVAQESEHPPSIEFAVGYQAEFYQLLGDRERVLKVADESLRITAVRRSVFWNPMITVYQGWATSVGGDPEKGVEIIRDGIHRYRAAGNGLTQIHMLALLAESLIQCDQWDAAMTPLVEARTLARTTGERYYLPEIHRIEGEVHRHSGKTGAAESAFLRAAELARSQGALSLELRAAMSLYQLKGDDASRFTLAQTFGQFTEGFSTPDLLAAKTLLSEVAA